MKNSQFYLILLFLNSICYKLDKSHSWFDYSFSVFLSIVAIYFTITETDGNNISIDVKDIEAMDIKYKDRFDL